MEWDGCIYIAEERAREGGKGTGNLLKMVLKLCNICRGAGGVLMMVVLFAGRGTCDEERRRKGEGK